MLGMPRTAKRLLALSVDASLCVLTTWLAFYLRLDDWVLLSGRPLWAAVASMAIALPIFIVSGLYRAIFRYSGLPAMIAVLKAIVIYGLVYSAIFTAVGVNGIPRTVGLIQPILLLLTVGSSRYRPCQRPAIWHARLPVRCRPTISTYNRHHATAGIPPASLLPAIVYRRGWPTA
jgi:FlaA1/EpsC-like NDP-sugar epimerase